MKQFIFGTLVTLLIYFGLRLSIFFSDLSLTSQLIKIFLFAGIILAFCWSSFLYFAGKVNFSLATNVVYLSIALSLLLIYGKLVSYWVLFILVFFLVFSLIFSIYNFFLEHDLRNKLKLKLVALIFFVVIVIIVTQTERFIF